MPKTEGLVFNDVGERVEITPREKAIGIKTYHLYTTKIHRDLPWLIRDGRIIVKRREDILTDGLEKEQISDTLASVIRDFKWTEDHLTDFTGKSLAAVRNIWGIQRSYSQWGHEEGQHSDATGLILIRTGHATNLVLEEEYYRNIEDSWKPPYSTVRQNMIYGRVQEFMANRAYEATAERAKEEGALITAQILRLISGDEGYHGGGYNGFVHIYAEDDLEGTIADTLEVSRTFRMPLQDQLPNKQQALLNARRVGAFSKGMVEKVIYDSLKKFDFLPEGMAKKAADNYWKKRD